VPCKLLLSIYIYSSAYQWDNDFAVRVCLEVVFLLEALAEDTVVVDLAIDRQGDLLIVAH
jgi:hypothetical protein